MLNEFMGLDNVFPVTDGNIYFKGGTWGNRTTGQREIALAFFMPDNIDCAIFINSDAMGLGLGTGQSIQEDIVVAEYNNNLV